MDAPTLQKALLSTSGQESEEKTSRCINYDKNTEIFNRLQLALKSQNMLRE
jgi:hypothetical protein